MPGVPETTLSERDAEVLETIEEEALTGFTFDGLKRRLGAHPETLSRILRRLEDHGVLEKALDGYRVTAKAKQLLELHRLSAIEPYVPLLQTLLPRDVTFRKIVSDLKGKWFGPLRWLGYSEGEDGLTLKWITEDGGILIIARFTDGELNIEARLRKEKDLNDAVRASHQLMTVIARMYSRPDRRRLIAFFKIFEPSIMPA